jgi:hypothetical protein
LGCIRNGARSKISITIFTYTTLASNKTDSNTIFKPTRICKMEKINAPWQLPPCALSLPSSPRPRNPCLHRHRSHPQGRTVAGTTDGRARPTAAVRTRGKEVEITEAIADPASTSGLPISTSTRVQVAAPPLGAPSVDQHSSPSPPPSHSREQPRQV